MTARKRPDNAVTPAEFKKAKAESPLELEMELQIKQAGLPKPVREAKNIPNKEYRSDFSWPEYKITLEVDGGIWIKGRHGTGTGITTDCLKQNWLTALGWRQLRVTDKQIKSGEAIKWLQMTIHYVKGEQASE